MTTSNPFTKLFLFCLAVNIPQRLLSQVEELLPARLPLVPFDLLSSTLWAVARLQIQPDQQLLDVVAAHILGTPPGSTSSSSNRTTTSSICTSTRGGSGNSTLEAKPRSSSSEEANTNSSSSRNDGVVCDGDTRGLDLQEAQQLQDRRMSHAAASTSTSSSSSSSRRRSSHEYQIERMAAQQQKHHQQQQRHRQQQQQQQEQIDQKNDQQQQQQQQERSNHKHEYQQQQQQQRESDSGGSSPPSPLLLHHPSCLLATADSRSFRAILYSYNSFGYAGLTFWGAVAHIAEGQLQQLPSNVMGNILKAITEIYYSSMKLGGQGKQAAAAAVSEMGAAGAAVQGEAAARAGGRESRGDSVSAKGCPEKAAAAGAEVSEPRGEHSLDGREELGVGWGAGGTKEPTHASETSVGPSSSSPPHILPGGSHSNGSSSSSNGMWSINSSSSSVSHEAAAIAALDSFTLSLVLVLSSRPSWGVEWRMRDVAALTSALAISAAGRESTQRLMQVRGGGGRGSHKMDPTVITFSYMP